MAGMDVAWTGWTWRGRDGRGELGMDVESSGEPWHRQRVGAVSRRSALSSRVPRCNLGCLESS